jgi:hypothetical protein
MIKAFLRHTFISRDVSTGGPITGNGADENLPVFPVDEVPQPDQDSDSGTKGPDDQIERRTRAKVILLINWVVAIALLSSLGFVFAYAFTNPGTAAPEIITNIIAGTVSYFGGALVSYLDRSTGHSQTQMVHSRGKGPHASINR